MDRVNQDSMATRKQREKQKKVMQRCFYPIRMNSDWLFIFALQASRDVDQLLHPTADS